jgi:transglutaminase-like putative cysteine protease
VLSLSMAIAPFIAAWMVAAVTALVLGQRAQLACLPALSSAPVPRARALGRTLVAVVATLLVMVVIAIGVFMVAPVAGTDRSLTFPAQLPQTQAVPVLGGLANPSLGAGDPSQPVQPGDPRGGRASFGYFGFSDELDTATRGRPDDTLVMRVRASAPDYWRGQSFDEWDGRVWRVSEPDPRPIRGGQPIPVPSAPDDGPPPSIVSTDELVQTYYVERPGPNAIFAASTPTRLYFPERTAFQVPDGSLRAGVQLEDDSVYTVVSRRPLATGPALRASDPFDVPLRIREKYAAPPVTTDRVRALALAVTADAPTTYDKVRALERWMGDHTRYTLDIPPLPRRQDAVDRFLFVDRRGFCEQIGTSLVVMLRAIGIPARLAVGYATGERNPFTGLYEVRAKDAHAWAEVYFPGIGWQGFDPTASVPLAGDSAIDAAGTGAFAYLNARISLPGWIVPVAVAAVAAAALAVGVLLATRRLRRRRARVAPTWAGARLTRLDRLGAGRGRARAPGETAPEYGRALTRLDPGAAPELRSIVQLIDTDMFSGHPLAEADRKTVDAALDHVALRWRGNPAPQPTLVRD